MLAGYQTREKKTICVGKLVVEKFGHHLYEQRFRNPEQERDQLANSAIP